MTTIRRLGAITIAAPLAMGFTLIGAPASMAASDLTVSPGDGAVVTSSSLTVKGSVGDSSDARLTFDGVSYEGSGSVSRTYDAHQLRNGSYTAKIEKKWGLLWIANKSATFRLRTPPYRPSGLSASVSGHKLKVTWSLGPEPDLAGYDVTASGLGTKSPSDGSACSGTMCSATFTLPSSASGNVSVSVRARRSSGSGGTLSSAGSSTSATIPGGGSGGGGGNGGSGGAPGGGYPGGGGSVLPVNTDSPVSLPTVAPDGATPGFQYPTPVPDVAQNPVPAPNAEKVAAVDNVQWGKSIASALILLIVAAHLGTWTRRTKASTATLGGSGMAARISRAGSGRARVRMTRASIAHAEAAAKAAALMESSGKSGKGKDTKGRKARAAANASAAKPKSAASPSSAPGGKPASKPKVTGRGRHKAKANAKTAVMKAVGDDKSTTTPVADESASPGKHASRS